MIIDLRYSQNLPDEALVIFTGCTHAKPKVIDPWPALHNILFFWAAGSIIS
jgi:hypothetical protein